MSIKGQEVAPSFARLGIIRLGDRKTTSKPGKATPYFQLRDALELRQWYDKQPTELNVFWPFNDVDRNVDDAYRLYGAGSIKCRGDGETMDTCLKGAEFVVSGGVCLKSFAENGKSFKPGDIVPCNGPGAAGCYPKCMKCSIISYPKVMIIEAMKAGHFGYYQIGSGSTSKHGRANIRGALEAVRELVRFLTGTPAIAGVPMILSLKVQSITVPLRDKTTGEGYRARMDKPILHLVPHPDWVKAQTSTMLEQAYQPLARLPSPMAQLQPPPVAAEVLGGDASAETAQAELQACIEETWQDGPGFEEGEFTEAGLPPKPKEEPKPTRDVAAIVTFGHCWQACTEDFGLDRSQALKELGVTEQKDLDASREPREFYLEIAEVREQRGEREGQV